MPTTKKKASDKAPKRGSVAWHKAVERRLQELTSDVIEAREQRVMMESRLTAVELEQAQRPSEEDRLRDAVVDAALAWKVSSGGATHAILFWDAVEALRAHRAKKGGA